ncbi:MAG: RNA polymerase subunit sigma-24, partial [Oscillospiraceae bacterium]|nr:RNA polymerase subunit sigma-24 [Oscillospiraceae bacterium]
MNHTQRDKEFLALLVTAPDDGLAAIMDAYTAFAWTIVHGKLSGAFGKHDIEECVSDVFYELYKTRNAIDLEKG